MVPMMTASSSAPPAPAPLVDHPTLPAHPDVTIVSSQRVWNGRFPLDVVGFRQRRFDGSESGLRTWELWRRGRAAALLPYDPTADAVVLIEQFRLPALAAGMEPVMAEIPAGLLDQPGSAEATAVRETQEEAGLVPDRVVSIGEFLLSPGGCDEACSLFMGRVRVPATDAGGIAGMAGLAVENEDIRVRVWPAVEAIEAALAGRFPNVVTMVALLCLAARRDWLRQEWART
jgi:ADP-ribose pyrophosphatase